MGKIYSSLRSRLITKQSSLEQQLHNELIEFNEGILKYYLEEQEGASYNSYFNFEEYADVSLCREVSTLKPVVKSLHLLSLNYVCKHSKLSSISSHCNRLLSSIKAQVMKKLYISGTLFVMQDFSPYARNIYKAMNATCNVVQFSRLRISHKEFGRILVSAPESCKLIFELCHITINHLGYLSNARVAVKSLVLFRNSITQPEEDNENFDRLVEKIAHSRLNDSLTLLTIFTDNIINDENSHIMLWTETLRGNITVRIY
ncbi:unnamed protein product [Moneuplotes crassus]|uniref:Uncharacterized protein n=1 Tax=Euplotes crassus TaxID=5936 RepID=A0AAD1XR25_EUPCR|nr:unnamed protein product [Moneuplotes crassus]